MSRTQFVNDISGDLTKVLVAKNTSTNTSNYFVQGPQTISEGGTGGTSRQYYLDDGMGNIRFVTDNSGNKLQYLSYDPYGNQLTGNGGTFQYKGEQLDQGSMYFMRARYYDPTTGRFISKDPVEGYLIDPQTQNGYNYANVNPVNLSDPSGKDVYNNSDQYILVKEENEKIDTYSVWAPGSTYQGAQDGVIFHDGTIYKNGNGVNINVTSPTSSGVSNATPLDSAREGVNNGIKAVNNLLPGQDKEYSGQYRLNDNSQTGTMWKPPVCWL